MAADSEASSLVSLLLVPLPFVIGRIKNLREARLMLDAGASAELFDSLLQHYETFANAAQQLQEAWDAVWLAEEPLLSAAIPLIGEEMSACNRARCLLLEKMETTLHVFQDQAAAVQQFADVNAMIAEELLAEGVERLAGEKSLLGSWPRGCWPSAAAQPRRSAGPWRTTSHPSWSAAPPGPRSPASNSTPKTTRMPTPGVILALLGRSNVPTLPSGSGRPLSAR